MILLHGGVAEYNAHVQGGYEPPVNGGSETTSSGYDDVYSIVEYFDSISTVSRAIGGIAALFYISFCVWKHMANAEPINFFPLLRPFTICLCIMFFPLIINFTNDILDQVTHAFGSKVEKSFKPTFDCNSDVSSEKIVEKVAKGALQPYVDMGIGIYNFFADKKIEKYSNFIVSSIECILRNLVTAIFETLLEAVKIGLMVIRTFFLKVLITVGPLAFAFSIFDGFEGNLTAWLKKYISIYLWLPVFNILNVMCQEWAFDVENSFALFLIYTFVCLYSFLKIPEISGWIVEAPGGFEREWGSKGAGFIINNAKEAIKGVASKGKK